MALGTMFRDVLFGVYLKVSILRRDWRTPCEPLTARQKPRGGRRHTLHDGAAAKHEAKT